MAALTTVANVKQYLSLTGDTTDDLLSRLIDAASAFVENWLGRQVLQATVTEWQSGNGKEALLLAQSPVVSVESVTVGDQTIRAAATLSEMGWRQTERWLIYQHGHFAKGMKNVRIEYTAGFDVVPADIEQAVIDLVSLRFKERDRIGHISKSLAGETVSYMISDLSAPTRMALQHYKRVVL